MTFIHKIALVASLLIITLSVVAQTKLPIIKATSNKVDIRDDGDFGKGSWNISPKLKPDLYITRNKNKKVTFYTDLDSISFIIRPGEKYDFVILLNKKDSALTRIVYEPSYLETLKKAGKYNLSDNRVIPKFTYQSFNDTNLVLLRKTFRLDSVAGTGNEISQILNILHWLHNKVPHDGQNMLPGTLNAMSMFNFCTNEKRGLNCRGLAMALNECYLSLGIKSRYVTCLPKDSLKIDTDCHVINMVYSSSLKKWLWIDPTNDAYVMNEKGELLSIEEVRDRIIHDKPLILNPDANWNHKSSTLKEDYLYNYMAKNLYILECPVRSEFDTETRVKGKQFLYVQLLPLDYFKQFPDKVETKEQKAGITSTFYKTNNPASFWQIPNLTHNPEIIK